MYELNPQVDTSGTDDLMMFEFPPVAIVKLFGEGSGGDGYKVSRKHVFTNDRGDVFTVYDWKQTTLYRGESGSVPTPEQFWRTRELKFLHVGGKVGTNPRPFLKWLQGLNEFSSATPRAMAR